MPFSTAARNTMLDAEAAVTDFVSLHTADPTAGSNEVTGGSPAYARKAVTWAAASGGAALANGTDPVFDVPTATTVVAIGYWDAVSAGSFRGWSPLNGGTVIPFYAANTGDLFTADAHGLANGDRVYLHAVSGSALPTGVSEGVLYFVVSVSGDTFQVSLTLGGAAVVLTTDGAGMLQEGTPETFGAQGTLTVTDQTLRLTA